MALCFAVQGPTRLAGSLHIDGAKNAVLPILAAALLCQDELQISNCPDLSDVHNMLRILEGLGCTYRFEDGVITLDTRTANSYKMPDGLSHELRSSIFLLGPIIGRFGQAVFGYPGGCEIGLRPIDLHLKGLRALNADIIEAGGHIICRASRLKGAQIHLDYPSVGATENIMMAAARAQGTTLIHNAAREPEIEDLQAFLNAMGARVSGAGGELIRVEGVERLHGCQYSVMPDRIVAGTMLAAAAITRGDVELRGLCSAHLSAAIAKLREAGCELLVQPDTIRIRCPQRPLAVKRIETLPYPGFPTDMQAQFFALSTVSQGTTIVVENVFENRFRHASELIRMGACATIRDRLAIITGVETLTAADVVATDLRGGAALMLAAIAGQGCSHVSGIHHIERGYASLDGALIQLGADITRVEADLPAL